MNPKARKVQRTYLTLLLCNTLAASLIWGINTIFLLDAGLSNLEAFAANAFYTAGMVLFEIPTGVIADLKGRRTSFLLGTLTLAASTLMYLALWQMEAPFWAWAIVSAFLGLGFTFFSGATEAWLVDALQASGYGGRLETVFARGQVIGGVAMLAGSLGGGVIAQMSNLGVPYILRGAILLVSFTLAWRLMHDMGFTPLSGKHPAREIKHILDNSIEHGLRNRPVRWIMLTGPFTLGVSVYGFYALQPYLLELWGDPTAYALAGVAAAILAGAQIAGGLVTPHLSRLFRRRTTLLFSAALLSTLAVLGMGLFDNFWVVIGLVIVWGLMFSVSMPVRQAYINGYIPANQRATVLSFDSLMGSAGGAVVQPILGKAADVWNYPTSYILGAGLQTFALPFFWLARRAAARGKAKRTDTISPDENPGKPE